MQKQNDDIILADSKSAVPLLLCAVDEWDDKKSTLSKAQQLWCETCGIAADNSTADSDDNSDAKSTKNKSEIKIKPGSVLLSSETGALERVVCVVADKKNLGWNKLWSLLPHGDYQLECDWSEQESLAWVVDWGRRQYKFNESSKNSKPLCKPIHKLVWSSCAAKQLSEVNILLLAEQRCQRWIDLPAEDLNPSTFPKEIKLMADQYSAKVEVIDGDDLRDNYSGIYTVGRAAAEPPCLVHLTWGDSSHPRVALVGKGVCFDTGGLNLKPGGGMLLMKKDMAGAAHVCALAEIIMQQQLPVCLDVWVPAVDNAIDGNAYRPGDVITMRDGTRVEVTNTDAEGRLVLADALVAAQELKPDLLIDMATLTGAARVAVGPDLIPVFGQKPETVHDLMNATELDDFVELPLYQPYKKFLDSKTSDIINASFKPMAGAITAALFLQHFVQAEQDWMHLDIYAHDGTAGAAGLAGARAQGLMSLFLMIKERY